MGRKEARIWKSAGTRPSISSPSTPPWSVWSGGWTPWTPCWWWRIGAGRRRPSVSPCPRASKPTAFPAGPGSSRWRSGWAGSTPSGGRTPIGNWWAAPPSSTSSRRTRPCKRITSPPRPRCASIWLTAPRSTAFTCATWPPRTSRSIPSTRCSSTSPRTLAPTASRPGP